MSTTIDNKVVEMRFDNRDFERNAETSMSTLEKLKQSLKLKGAADGFQEVDSAAKKISFAGLTNAVDTVGLKFNAMYTIADQALRNITNSAMAAGKRIASALTIAPIKTGLQEYETQIGAVQTILANTESKGSTLNDVNKALDELNTYADKTIYNFTEMTRNIGTFTAAGVDLDTSVKSIQGIANLAAVSGSTSQQASTAMYQLSQALAAGKVSLMDWNSVVNAGMGGQVFQDALKRTAKAMGKDVDGMIQKYGSFRESLTQGEWLTADVLTKTLEQFTMAAEEGSEQWEKYKKSLMSEGYTEKQATEILKMANTATDAATKVKTFTQLWDTLQETAQSGWTQTWEILFGDFEEAKEFFSNLYNTFAPMIETMSKARNDLLEGWSKEGGRTMVIDSLFNIIEGIGSIVKPIKEAFRDIFPPMTVDQLVKFTEGLKSLTERLKISEDTSDKLKRTFKGLFAILDIGKQLLGAVFKAIKPLFGGVGDLSGGILDLTARFGDWLVKLDESIKSSGVFVKIADGIATAIKFVTKVVKGLLTLLKDKILTPGWELFHSFLEAFHERLGSVGEAVGAVRESISNSFDSMGDALSSSSFFKLFQGLWKGVATISSAIVKVISELGRGVINLFSGADFGSFVDILNAIISGGIGVGIAKFLNSTVKTLESFGDIASGVVDVFDGVRGSIEAYQTQLKAGTLLKIASAIGILALALVVIASIDSEKLFGAIAAISALFFVLTNTITSLGKTMAGSSGIKGLVKDLANMKALASIMVTVSLAILILSAAVKQLGSLDFDELVKGLVGVAALMAIVIGSMKILGQGNNAVIKGATQMVIFAAAIKILASAVEDLGYLDFATLTKGLLGVGVLLAEVSLFMNTAKFSGKAITTATGIVILAAGIKILASACDDFGRMDWGSIGKGLASIAILLAELIIFTNLTGKAKHVVSTGVALIAIAAAMKIFVSAAEDIAEMSWGDIAKGLVALAGSLTAITLALRLMPKNMVSMGVGFIALSTSLLILATVLANLGGMSWEGIAKGLISLGGSMLILAVGLHAMKGTLSGSAALIVATIALGGLVPVLSILGAMSWGSIAKGLLSIAGTFAVIGIAGKLLTPVIPSILALSGALVLLGVGMVAFGAGVTALGIGLATLATAIAAWEATLAAFIAGIVGLVSAVIVGILKGLGEGIIAFCQVIIDGIPAIAKAIKVLVLAVCDVLVECVPAIVKTVLALVAALLKSLADYAPQIIASLFDFLIGILNGIADHLPELIKAALNILGRFFEGVINALGSIDYGTMIDGILAIGLLAGLMAALSAVAGMIPGAMVGVLGMGLVIAELALVLAAIGAFAQIPGLSWLVEEGGDFLKKVGNAIGGFIGGIAGGIAEGISSALPQIGSDLAAFMQNAQPFIDGASMIDSSVMDGVKTLVGVLIALTGANIFEKLTSWMTGGSALAQFGQELALFGPSMKQYADSVADIDASAVQASANAAKALAEMTSTIPNSGGVASWFAGENSISQFGTELISLGEGLKGFSDSIVGVNPEAITATANAAKAIADMTSIIPNSGGVASWFAGDNSIAKFGNELILLGEGLRGFALTTIGIAPDSIIGTANAAKALADMTNYIPNSGGVAAWFAGENSIASFSEDLVRLGQGLAMFSIWTASINTEHLAATATAAKALADMTNHIPNSGGVASWFAGENSVANFSSELVTLGQGLAGFAISTMGIDPSSLAATATAAQALAEMTNHIPNSGGVVSWFAGDNSISKFGNELISLGAGIKGFAMATAGIAPDGLTAAATAAKSLAEMSSYIPNEGGVVSWFAGESSIANFADKLPVLGEGLKGFSTSIEGINPENVTAAAGAAKALAEMTAVIPTEGGVKAWFTGKTSIANFANKLPTLGEGLKGFSDSVEGISPENTTAAASAAKSLGEMTAVIPKNTDKLGDFGDNLVAFGDDLKSYFDNTQGITSESIAATKNAVDSLKDISTLNAGNIKSTAKAIDDIADTLKNLSRIPKDSTAKFTKAMEELGKTSGDGLVDALNDIKDDTKKAGDNAMTSFADGIKKAVSKAESACKGVIDACAKALSGSKKSFSSAGADVVAGFASGISANTYKAEAKAKAMAKAAALAAEKALGIESPSKVFYGIGEYSGMGFINALDRYADISYKSGETMAESAKSGLSRAIAKIKDIISGDVDVNPTIRPVLDLSGVRTEARGIASILGAGASVGVMANVGAISTMMNRRNQNGGNSDIVSAIDKLRKDFNGAERGSTYNINGVTYDDGSNIADAVRTIVRAAKVERRK